MLGLVALVLVGLIAQAYLTAPNDEALVRETLRDMVAASREGRSNPVLDGLARSFTLNGSPIEDKREVARFIRASRPQIEFESVNPQVAGDRAMVVSAVSVRADTGPFPIQQRFPQVTVSFEKTTGTRYFVLPFAKWRVTDVSIDGLDYSQLQE
ncbi:MAG: hypothetical protein KIT11_05030 [Fimbriimonadaceae bacterium]|nr:hypothetical protein [Fimbriimonadaceae bacterium]QYK56742.1 MAG: hypothetical protein KF733_04490 [Fimbriimonadaceae bacterium]